MKGGPSEPPYRRRLQTTLRCCFLREVVVNGEGERPGIKPGQVTVRKRNESESRLLLSKIAKTISKPRLVRGLQDKFRRNLSTGGTVSGYRWPDPGRGDSTERGNLRYRCRRKSRSGFFLPCVAAALRRCPCFAWSGLRALHLGATRKPQRDNPLLQQTQSSHVRAWLRHSAAIHNHSHRTQKPRPPVWSLAPALRRICFRQSRLRQSHCGWSK
jgi:hypothetical protein